MQAKELLIKLKQYLNTLKSIDNCIIKVDGQKISLCKINGSNLEIRPDFNYMRYHSSCTEKIWQDLNDANVSTRAALSIANKLRYLFTSFHNDQQTKIRYVPLEPIIKKARIGKTTYKKGTKK